MTSCASSGYAASRLVWCGGSILAFDRRCIPHRCVAPPPNSAAIPSSSRFALRAQRRSRCTGNFRHTTLAAIACLAWLVIAPPAALAQDSWLNVRPSLLRAEGDVAFGARWGAGIEPRHTSTLALSFPREMWWAARGTGAWASERALNPEPLLDGEAEFGMQVLLLRQRPCTPTDCPEDLVDFDLGYIVIAARVQGEMEQGADEGVFGAGVALLYRPPFGASLNGAGFLIPTLSLGLAAAWPLASAIRDSLDLDDDRFTRFEAAADWTLRLARPGVPAILQPVRFDAHLAVYRHSGDDRMSDPVTDMNGNFVALDLGYELTDRVPWVRHAFIRWSDGEHATLPFGRRAWLLGIVIGRTRQ